MKNKLLYLYTICVNLIILIKEIFTKDSEKQQKNESQCATMNQNMLLWKSTKHTGHWKEKSSKTTSR